MNILNVCHTSFHLQFVANEIYTYVIYVYILILY